MSAGPGAGTAAPQDPPVGLARLIQRAIDEGLLPPSAAERSPTEPRPWPVTLLTALGAWLAAVPLLLFVGALLGPLFDHGLGAYLAGAVALGLAWSLWRRAQASLFLEQLALPALLVGLGALGFALQRDVGAPAAAALLAAAVAGLSLALPQAWLRSLLGAGAALLAALALGGDEGLRLAGPAHVRWWGAWHLLLLVWLCGMALAPRLPSSARAAWAEGFGSGWLLAVVAGLALWSGISFLVAGSLGRSGGALLPGLRTASGALMHGASALCAALACGWAAQQWCGLRRVALLPAAAVLVGLSALMPSLGGVLLALAACTVSSRRTRALSAAVAAGWIVGAFYYALQWPLGHKALALVLAAVVLGAVAVGLRRRDTRVALSPLRGGPAPAAAAAPRWRSALLPLTAGLTLAATGGAAWQKEQLIAQGRPAFVELAPVDPRSLMQGDFMTLAWRMPEALRRELDDLASTQRPRVAARRDERQVLHLLRLLAPGQAPAAGEEALELSPKDGRWVVVTDAWFFREGEAERWQPARYGEFRLMPDGRALLVGLRGADLQPL